MLYILELKFNNVYIFCIVIFGFIFTILWKKIQKFKNSLFKKNTETWKNFAKHVHNCLPYKRVFKILYIHILISPNLAPILFINLLAYLDYLSSYLSSHYTHQPTCLSYVPLDIGPHPTYLPTKMTYLST